MNRTILFPILAAFVSLTAKLHAQQPSLTVTDDAKASEFVFTLGPIDLPAGMEDMPMMIQPKPQSVAIPIEAYLKGFTVEMFDAEGDTLPTNMLHHINIIAPQRRELFSQIMQRVGAAGAETGPLQLPRFVGYPIAAGDSLLFSVMFHNDSDQEFHNIQLRVRMKYSRPGIRPQIAVQPFYMDVMPPAGVHAYALPPGKSSKSWEGSPAIPGRVVGLGGHLHKYGTALRFEDVTAGKVLWEAKPVVDSTGEVVGMPRKFFLLGVELNPSHTYRVTADYDNPTGEEIEDGAMGTLGGLFVPDDRATWPAIDRDHPDYLADVKVTYNPVNTGMMMMHH